MTFRVPESQKLKSGKQFHNAKEQYLITKYVGTCIFKLKDSEISLNIAVSNPHTWNKNNILKKHVYSRTVINLGYPNVPTLET